MKGKLGCITEVSVRNGRIIYSYPFILNVPLQKEKGEIMQEFFLMHSFHLNSSKIYTETVLPDRELVKEFVQEIKGFKIQIATPRGKLQKDILSVAQDNASMHLKNYIEKRKGARNKKALNGLRDIFHLKELPMRIEGYDISNIAGKDAVGSMVVFTGGKPDKNEYRRFRIKYVEGPNDYAMLKEVLFRRFKNDSASFKTNPDIILIDGGKGQLSAAMKIKKLMELKVFVASIAKEEELIFVEGRNEPIRLSRDSEELMLLQRVRDESHRFAKVYFQKVHKKSMLKET